MFKRSIVAVSVLCLALPVGAFAQGFNQGDKELMGAVNGVSENDFDSSDINLEADLGYFFSRNIEGSLRQSLHFVNIEGGGSSVNAATRGAVDYNLDLGRFWPFVGAGIGYVYGHDVTDSWEAALEGGLKFFVNNSTFIVGRLEYQWLLNSDNNEGFNHGLWVYTIGIGFRW